MHKQDALPLIWHDSYDIEHYVVAACNEFAFQAIQDPKNWSMPILLVLGEATSGKTFLAEIFHTLYDAVKINNINDLKESIKVSNPRILDNADHFIKANPEAINDLFHLVNSSITDKIPFLLTATKPPQEWAHLPDLLSRLQAAQHAILEDPNDEMIKFAYRKFFTDRGILVDNRVLDYLTARSERSFAGIRKNVNILDKAALEQSRKITIPLIQELGIFE